MGCATLQNGNALCPVLGGCFVPGHSSPCLVRCLIHWLFWWRGVRWLRLPFLRPSMEGEGRDASGHRCAASSASWCLHGWRPPPVRHGSYRLCSGVCCCCNGCSVAARAVHHCRTFAIPGGWVWSSQVPVSSQSSPVASPTPPGWQVVFP
jgi:hypothetical protein